MWLDSGTLTQDTMPLPILCSLLHSNMLAGTLATERSATRSLLIVFAGGAREPKAQQPLQAKHVQSMLIFPIFSEQKHTESP